MPFQQALTFGKEQATQGFITKALYSFLARAPQVPCPLVLFRSELFVWDCSPSGNYKVVPETSHWFLMRQKSQNCNFLFMDSILSDTLKMLMKLSYYFTLSLLFSEICH